MLALRVGDGTTGMCVIGSECCPHGRSGVATNGAANVTINGRPAHRVGDNGSCNCPHGGTFTTNSGSATVTILGQPLARLGDSTSCMICGQFGSHTGGSSNVTCGA